MATDHEGEAMIVKEIVLLANSRKLSGRCLAGREVRKDTPGLWLRPVSDRPSEEVSEHERHYQDGSDPRVLDIVRIPLIEPTPGCHQPENWRLDPRYYWEKVGTFPVNRLPQLLDPPESLWFNVRSTYNGMNDEMPHSIADTTTSSLRFVVVPEVSLSVYAPGQAFNNPKRRVQATFDHAGARYALWVTDPDIERDYLAKPDGTYQFGPAYLTVSVAEPFNGNCHKLVAAIIPAGQ